MNKECPVCEYPLKDGDLVVAIMIARFKMLASDVNFAIEHPTECLDIIHEECYIEEDRPEDNGERMGS
jgi:hypothetical protein